MIWFIFALIAWFAASFYWLMCNLAEKHQRRSRVPPWEWWAAAPVLFLACCVDVVRWISRKLKR